MHSQDISDLTIQLGMLQKPYNLWDHLQFLLSYTKSRAQSGNLGVGSSPHKQGTAIDFEVDDANCDQPDEETVRNAEQNQRSTTTPF